MLGNIGPLEIIVVLIIALIVFGPKRLPELGNSLGKGIREFKDSVTGDHDDEVADADVKAVRASQATAVPAEPQPTPTPAQPPASTPVRPPTSHRIEADKAETVADKNS
jgi:sec-independent protein translocase protein TatA